MTSLRKIAERRGRSQFYDVQFPRGTEEICKKKKNLGVQQPVRQHRFRTQDFHFKDVLLTAEARLAWLVSAASTRWHDCCLFGLNTCCVGHVPKEQMAALSTESRTTFITARFSDRLTDSVPQRLSLKADGRSSALIGTTLLPITVTAK
jgi:hypothetical protein